MWIARDKSGQLVCLIAPPMRHTDGYWRGIMSTDSLYGIWVYPIPDFEHYFDNLKWEDEPIEVGLCPKKIDENKLDELAGKYCDKNRPSTFKEYFCSKDAFKAGYRKAKKG